MASGRILLASWKRLPLAPPKPISTEKIRFVTASKVVWAGRGCQGCPGGGGGRKVVWAGRGCQGCPDGGGGRKNTLLAARAHERGDHDTPERCSRLKRT